MNGKYVVKDIIKALEDNEIDVLVQGCNCFCQFGKGLAALIEKRFPEALEADKETIIGDVNKLGTYSLAEVLPNRFVLNAYTQYHWIKNLNNEKKIFKNGRKVVLLADYIAIKNVMDNIMKDFSKDTRFGIPKIGAGYANGDWKIIEKIIKDTLIKNGFNVTFYVISKDEIPT